MKISLENSTLKAKHYDEEYFVSASFDDTILYRCAFDSCRFEGGELMYSKFIRCEFSDVIFYFVNQLNNVFVSCNFINVRFGGTNFTDVTFVDCKFNDVLFRPDNLGKGCDLSAANFINCDFVASRSINSKIDDECPPPEGIRIDDLPLRNIDNI